MVPTLFLRGGLRVRCDPNKTPEKCAATRVLDRPVMWLWTGELGLQ